MLEAGGVDAGSECAQALRDLLGVARAGGAAVEEGAPETPPTTREQKAEALADVLARPLAPDWGKRPSHLLPSGPPQLLLARAGQLIPPPKLLCRKK